MLDVRCENRVSEQGFTLIEVLVASAIIMASIGVLMQLFASGLDRTQRAGQVAHLLLAERVIAHALEELNPVLHRDGEGMAEGLRYRWHAAVEAPFRKVYDPAGVLAGREVALFALVISVETARGGTYQFTLYQLGWRPHS